VAPVGQQFGVFACQQQELIDARANVRILFQAVSIPLFHRVVSNCSFFPRPPTSPNATTWLFWSNFEADRGQNDVGPPLGGGTLFAATSLSSGFVRQIDAAWW
jgi:hypothetical protein